MAANNTEYYDIEHYFVADSNQLLAHEESSILKKTFVYDNGTHHLGN